MASGLWHELFRVQSNVSSGRGNNATNAYAPFRPFKLSVRVIGIKTPLALVQDRQQHLNEDKTKRDVVHEMQGDPVEIWLQCIICRSAYTAHLQVISILMGTDFGGELSKTQDMTALTHMGSLLQQRYVNTNDTR